MNASTCHKQEFGRIDRLLSSHPMSELEDTAPRSRRRRCWPPRGHRRPHRTDALEISHVSSDRTVALPPGTRFRLPEVVLDAIDREHARGGPVIRGERGGRAPFDSGTGLPGARRESTRPRGQRSAVYRRDAMTLYRSLQTGADSFAHLVHTEWPKFRPGRGQVAEIR